MQILFLTFLLGLLNSFCSAGGLNGPFLFWGHNRVKSLQPHSLVEGEKKDFIQLYKDAKAIVVFVRNSTTPRLNSAQFPQLQGLIHNQDWTYLPQRDLIVEPFNFNSNIEVINLSNSDSTEDEEIISGFNDANSVYGEGGVLGILANSGREDKSVHFISKRESKDNEQNSTTAQTATAEETDESSIYIADGNKAMLYVNSPIVLNISNKESIKLVKHHKLITFDDQNAKGYGRLNIIFTSDGDKIFLRFNFTLKQGSWTMRTVELEYKENKSVLALSGFEYGWPSAPLKFSYRCSANQLVFRSGNDSLTLNDYQVQPWLSNNSARFGDIYDCIGFTTAPIWAGVLVSLFFCGILSIGLMALYDIKTPNKFESSRSKQLTFAVQE